jgi:hypothetical protein
MKYILPETHAQSTYTHCRKFTSKTALFQLDLSAFLRVRARGATGHGEAIAPLVPTDAIALTNLHANACLSKEGWHSGGT